MRFIIIFALSFCLTSSSGFISTSSIGISQTLSNQDATYLFASKGFGGEKPKPRPKSKGQIKRDEASNKYDEVAETGGTEYRIFVRQFGGDDESWLPTGSIAVPRGAQVSDAIYAGEDQLKSSIVRTYPKLKGSEDEFEFGYNLKIYPDDPIEVAVKGSGKTDGPSIGNWISTLLSPIDNSNLKK